MTLHAPAIDVNGSGVPACRVCGCTDHEACEQSCWWIEDPVGIGELCSTCLQLALALDAAQTAIAAAGHPLNAHQIATSIGVEPTAQLHRLLRELARRGHLRCRGVRIRWYGLPQPDMKAGA